MVADNWRGAGSHVVPKDQAGAVKKFATAWFALVFVVSLLLLSYDARAAECSS
jgi:hypothetical protein